MPVESAIILSIIVLAFVIFGIVIAWAEARTRDLPRPQPSETATHPGHVDDLKKAA